MSQPEISIIILNYKSRGLTANCLRSLAEARLPEHEIIVVDNASDPRLPDYLREVLPPEMSWSFLASPRNGGYGSGINLGAREARGRYLLILNPDIHVFPDSIEKLYQYALTRPDLGVLSPKLLNPDRSLQYTCYRWHRPLTPIYRRTVLGRLPWARKSLAEFLMTEWSHDAIAEVDWIQGSCWLVPKNLFDDLTGFDERFFMYFEDTDFCRRAASRGRKNVYFAESEVIHLHARQSLGGIKDVFTNRLTREHIKSWLKYALKWRANKERSV